MNLQHVRTRYDELPQWQKNVLFVLGVAFLCVPVGTYVFHSVITVEHHHTNSEVYYAGLICATGLMMVTPKNTISFAEKISSRKKGKTE